MAKYVCNLDLTLSNKKVYTYMQTKNIFQRKLFTKKLRLVISGRCTIFCFMHFQNTVQKHESYLKYKCHALKACISKARREKYAIYKTLCFSIHIHLTSTIYM